MRRVLQAIIIGISLITLAVMSSFLVYRHRQDSATRSKSAAEWNLGAGSIRSDETSKVASDFLLTPELLTLPVPTNTWWQSALTGTWPDNLFNLPWATKLSSAGLQTNIPAVTATADTITAAFEADLTLAPASGKLTSSKVAGYDDLSVLLRAANEQGATAFEVRLVKGLPFEYITFDQTLQLSAAGGAVPAVRSLADGRHVIEFTIKSRRYAIYASPSVKLGGDPATLQLTPGRRGDTLVIGALPDGAPATTISAFDDAAKVWVTGGRASFSVSGQKVTTTLGWTTGGSSASFLHLVLPHQAAAGARTDAGLGSYTTLRGPAILSRGTELVYTQEQPTTAATLSLPVNDSGFTKVQLESYLQAERSRLAGTAPGSYNGAKELFRLANLLMMAREASSPTAADFQARLHSELADWFTYDAGETSHYFYYDAKVRGLVAAAPEYGSEKFNDHHFHYGYFLYAASMLGRYEPKFVKDYGKVVDLLVQDIADTSDTDPSFPRLRHYDAYEGHSWAAGLDKFADGNNQESVSEAVNAWYGVMQWGDVSGNGATRQLGAWLYANETAAALTYYYQASGKILPAAYQHHQVSLLWGGKADWSTWFSPAPEAKHAILMLPLSGGSLYLGTRGNMTADFKALEAELGGKARSAYQDILLMAQALNDPAAASAGFSPTMTPDNSNTTAYTYYWLAWARQNQAKVPSK